MWCIICVSLWNQLFCQTGCRCIIFILVWILKSFRSNNDCLTKSKIKKIRYLKYEFRTSRRYNTRKIFLNAILLKIWGHFFLIYNENYSHYMDLPFLNFGYTFVIRYSLFVIYASENTRTSLSWHCHEEYGIWWKSGDISPLWYWISLSRDPFWCPYCNIEWTQILKFTHCNQKIP